MKLTRLIARVTPLLGKAFGRLPLCPWGAVFAPLDPRTLGGIPPAQVIETCERDGKLKLLRFQEERSFWFPEVAPISPELWSEYLCVFWEHAANSHYYLRQRTLIVDGDVCVDCGACEGFFTKQALERGASKVICVEPSIEMADCLRKTFAPEVNDGRVIVVNAAAGGVDGTCGFTASSTDPFSGKVSQSSGAQTRMVTIDTLSLELGLDRIDFIKMDIEGAEVQALEGALKILRRDHPKLAITTYHREFDYAVLAAYLRSFGYGLHPAGITRRDTGTYRPVMVHAIG